MSLKGIELQIAIPKTFDAGKIAEQKQQQSQVNQDLANRLTEEQVIKNRETVLEAETSAKADADKKNREEQEEKEKRRILKEEEERTVHPYKGSFVDFTG